ncbi:IclR family transcriptional regulator [Burkholderiaceae bacterium DAT-1]|nr:IclR family transcriptional regulator [Burkholderiaceae bacterium DAT-1]
MSTQPHAAPEDDLSNDRLFVTALARGLDILQAFGMQDRQLGNQELAQRTGLPKSTVSRLTYTLTKLGYLQQDPVSSKYLPGLKVLTLGFAALAQVDVRERARPLMRALSQETGLSVTLGCLMGTRVVYVEACRATTRVGIKLDVGASVPLVSTAIGRAIYASLDASQRSQTTDALALEYGGSWPDWQERLHTGAAEISQDGFCRSFGEFEPDIFAVAVPLRGQESPMAINCSGPAYRLTPEQWAGEIAPKLRELAGRLGGA